jgi:putative flippase GtrA
MSPVKTAKRIGRGTRNAANWVQLLQFGLVGLSGYVVNLTVFAIFTGAGLFFREGSDGLGVHYIPAAVAAFCVAVTNNFLWNRHWTFDAKHGHAGFQAARFFAVSVAAFLVAASVLEVLVSVVGLPEVPAQAISIVAATPLNFIGNKMWSFAVELHRD